MQEKCYQKQKVNLLMEKKLKLHAFIYYFALAIYIFFSACSHSMIARVSGMELIIRICRYGSLMIMIIKPLLLRKSFLSSVIIWLLGGFLCLSIFINMDSVLPISLIIVLLSSERCDGDIIGKIYLCSSGAVVLLSLFLSQKGIIEDKIIVRGSSGRLRHAMGMQYATVWAAFVFFLICAIIFLCRKIAFLHIVGFFFITAYMYLKSDARLETAMMMLMVVLVLLYQKGFLENKFVGFFLKNSVLISCIIAVGMQVAYMIDPVRFSPLNILLSGRLRITSSVIREQGLHLLGKDFFMQGFGTRDFDWSLGYNYVDSFYLNYALRYGVLFVVFICILFTYICRKLYKYNRKWILLFLAIGALHGIIISSAFLPQCNPFFVIAFAEYTSIHSKRS